MFISTKKKYQISLTKEEEDFIEQFQSSASIIDTIVFVDKLENGSEEEKLVHKILSAAKLSTNQYVIVDKSKYSNVKLMSFDKRKFSALQHVISFGVPFSAVGLNTVNVGYSFFKLLDFEILLVEAVSVLIGESRKKGMLWSEMKKMYEIE